MHWIEFDRPRRKSRTMPRLAAALVAGSILGIAAVPSYLPEQGIVLPAVPEQAPVRPEIVRAINGPWYTRELRRETDPRWLAQADAAIRWATAKADRKLYWWEREWSQRPDCLERRGDGPVPPHPQVVAPENRPVLDVGHVADMMRHGYLDAQGVYHLVTRGKNARYHHDVYSGLKGGIVVVAGWYEFTQDVTGQIIYVSQTDGNDGSTGLSTTAGAGGPVLTLATGYSKIRSGYPDWLLLDSRDTWNEKLNLGQVRSGQDASNPWIIDRYGSSGGSCPTIAPALADGYALSGICLDGSPSRYMAVNHIKLDFSAWDGASGQPTGISILNAIESLLVQGVISHDGFGGFTILQLDANNRPQDLTFHRTSVYDNWNNYSSSPGGTLIGECDGLTCFGCRWDRNGQDGTGPHTQAHNTYWQHDNTGADIEGNISARASFSALGLRCGGTMYNNLCLQNPSSLGFGHAQATAATGECSYNVVLQSQDINGSNPIGWGLAVEQVTTGYFHHNAFLKNTLSTGNVSCMGAGTTTIGIRFEDNVIDRWVGNAAGGRGIYMECPSGTNTIKRNRVNQDGGYPLNISSFSAISTPLNNQYYSTQAAGNFMQPGQSTAQYVTASGDSTSTFTAPTFTDNTYDMAAYGTSISVGSMTIASFMSTCRAMTKGNWDDNYTAEAVNAAFRVAYDIDAPPFAAGTGGFILSGQSVSFVYSGAASLQPAVPSPDPGNSINSGLVSMLYPHDASTTFKDTEDGTVSLASVSSAPVDTAVSIGGSDYTVGTCVADADSFQETSKSALTTAVSGNHSITIAFQPKGFSAIGTATPVFCVATDTPEAPPYYAAAITLHNDGGVLKVRGNCWGLNTTGMYDIDALTNTLVIVTQTYNATSGATELFVNGTSRASGTQSVGSFGASPQTCVGGFLGAARTPNAKIAGVQIHNRILSGAEITTLSTDFWGGLNGANIDAAQGSYALTGQDVTFSVTAAPASPQRGGRGRYRLRRRW